MEIERLWGNPPGWFLTQPHGVRVSLLAWYGVHRETG